MIVSSGCVINNDGDDMIKRATTGREVEFWRHDPLALRNFSTIARGSCVPNQILDYSCVPGTVHANIKQSKSKCRHIFIFVSLNVNVFIGEANKIL
eukprot:scaffold96_cov167-Ochromonas_danica.AAC.31